METIAKNKMIATLPTSVQMEQHALMGTMIIHVIVIMVTMETVVRNKMIVILATIVSMEKPVLMQITVIIVVSKHSLYKFVKNSNYIIFLQWEKEIVYSRFVYCGVKLSVFVHFVENVQICKEDDQLRKWPF